MKYKFTVPVCFLMLLAVLTACKKTINAPLLSNSTIIAYDVPVSDGKIAGVIDETDKTITVYVPFYYELSVIDPQIKVADGATLKEKPEPVEVLNDKITYTVTGADKSTSTYRLIIKIQQVTPLAISEFSAADRTATFGLMGSITLYGNFFTTDVNKIKTVLVSKKSGVETTLGASGFGLKLLAFGEGYQLSSLGIPATLDTGLYFVKVSKLGITTQNKFPIRLIYTNPAIVVITANSFKQGEKITIKAAGSVFVNFTSFALTINGQQVDCPIISYNRSEAVIQIPESLAPGKYGTVPYTAKFTGYSDYKQTIGLEITSK